MRGLAVELVPGWAHLVTIMALKRLCERFQPDVLVAHAFSENLRAFTRGCWPRSPRWSMWNTIRTTTTGLLMRALYAPFSRNHEFA